MSIAKDFLIAFRDRTPKSTTTYLIDVRLRVFLQFLYVEYPYLQIVDAPTIPKKRMSCNRGAENYCRLAWPRTWYLVTSGQ